MKITDWPSTHVNLATGWALFVGTVLLGWGALVFNRPLNESLYVTLIIATGAWAGVAAPAALIGKRATTKPEMQTVVTEPGPPAKVTVTTTGPVADGEDTTGALPEHAMERGEK